MASSIPFHSGVCYEFNIYLAAANALVVGDTKEIEAQLRNGITTDPQENVLRVLQHEQSSALETFAAQVHCHGHLNAVLSNRAAVFGHVMK